MLKSFKVPLKEFATGDSQANLFVHHMRQAALNSKTLTPGNSNGETLDANSPREIL